MAESKVALISGAAGGIGSATARKFASEGWRVLLTDREKERLVATSRDIPGAPFFAGDIGLRSTCFDIVNWALGEAGRLDVLVNAAGIWREGPTEDCSEEDFDTVFAVNVKGLYFLTAAAIPALKRCEGVIVNLSSDAGIQGNQGAALYCASKGAVTLFTKALALELAPDGVRVNAVCPSDVMSPMLAFQARRYGNGDEKAYFDRLLAGYPQGQGKARFIAPEEIASLIFYLVRPEAAPITGAALSIDFGYSAGKF
jgi:NAD(P)-dependent dehydrogenase (short-subunit alcohol dehydrogenase family)